MQSAPCSQAYHSRIKSVGQNKTSGAPSRTQRPPFPYLRIETIRRAYQGTANAALTKTNVKPGPATSGTLQRVEAASTAITRDHTNNRLRDIRSLPASPLIQIGR